MESAAAAKGEVVANAHHLRPTEGTRIRAIYDRLMANKGLPIDWYLTADDPHGNCIRQLTDFYGLDIRKLSRGRWVLAGEWFGRTYVDYIAPHVNKRGAA